ncbi:MAG: hypothetical protein ABIS86_11810 [Streptosporangiaceae bacterium]
MNERISVAYAPLVALYQILDARLGEPDGGLEGAGWASRLAALRALRGGETVGDGTRLARVMVDPSSLERDAPDLRVVPDLEDLPGQVQAAVDAGERVLLFHGEDVVPDGILALAVEDGVPRRLGTAWDIELRGLRKNLLLLEQWPLDGASLASVRAGLEQREAELAEQRKRLTAEVAEHRAAIVESERAVDAAEEDLAQLTTQEAEAADQAAGQLAAFLEVQAVAEAAVQEADRAARAVAASTARCAELESAIAQLHTELERARQAEEQLSERLDHARTELPAATAEAERLTRAATEAEALSHATYYRMVSAESALSAERGRQNWSQKLHVSTARPGVAEQKAHVTARRREATDALAAAEQANEIRQRAEGERAGMAAFLDSGGQELEAAHAAQRRFAEEMPGLESELALARTDHESHTAQAAVAVDRAAQAAEPAEEARRTGRAAEERLATARGALAEASEAAQRARAAQEAATGAFALAETALERFAEEEDKVLTDGRQDVEAAETVELRTREQVEEALGDEAQDVWRERAMSRHEQLTLNPVEQAQVVCATPGAVPGGDYDVLIVGAAEQVTDGDFLTGAVLARRWVLVGDPDGEPPQLDPLYRDHVLALCALAEAGDGGQTQPIGLESYGPGVKAELERLRSADLWESRYRESFGKIQARLTALDLDPREVLTEALDQESLFVRICTLRSEV